jgi:hypothetical protein
MNFFGKEVLIVQAVKVVDNGGMENVEVIALKVNGVTEKH